MEPAECETEENDNKNGTANTLRSCTAAISYLVVDESTNNRQTDTIEAMSHITVESTLRRFDVKPGGMI